MNVTPNGRWVKMFFVTLASESVKVNGEALKEDWGSQSPVKDSNQKSSTCDEVGHPG
jgi:hypothetical protein